MKTNETQYAVGVLFRVHMHHRLGQGELLRSKVRRQKLVRRALHTRGSVRAAFVDECLREGS